MKRLRKSADPAEIKFDGVCSGIARYLGVDVIVVRAIWVILTVFTSGFPGVILYIACMVIISREGSSGDDDYDNNDDYVDLRKN